jgi:Tfp pilus assembly protein PilF
MDFQNFKREKTIDAVESPNEGVSTDLVRVDSTDIADKLPTVQVRSKWSMPGSSTDEPAKGGAPSLGQTGAIGALIMGVCGVAKSTAKAKASAKANTMSRTKRIVLFGVVVSLSASFAIFTAIMPDWCDLFMGHNRAVPALQHLGNTWRLLFGTGKVSNATIALDAACRKANAGDHLGAIRDYEQLAMTFPSPRLYNNLAIENQKLGREDYAFVCYSKALALNPNWPMSLIGRGAWYVEQKNYQAALTDFNRAIRIGYPQGYYYRAWLYRLMHQGELADRDERIILKHGYKNEQFTMVRRPPLDER